MNDDRLEGELQAALLQDDPGPVRDELRRRIAAVPDEGAPRRGLARLPRTSGWAASLEAVAAVVLIAAIIGIALGIRGSNLGPASSAGPSTTPTGPAPSGSTTPTPAPSTTPVTAPITGDWHGLNWSAPSAFPNFEAIDDIVAWNGGYIAAAQVLGLAVQVPGFWNSSDGTTWTPLNVDTTAFPDSQINGLVPTASGLLAWGWAGEPVCSGEGEGMTCEPRPVMVWTSPDGISWTQVADFSRLKGATIDGITVGSQGLVAVGDTGWEQPAIWVSATGATWQRLTLPSATFKDAHFSDVRATASGYVLAGGIGNSAPTSGGVQLPDTGSAAVWWSLDGRTWTKGTVNRADGVGTSLGSIYVGAKGMVAVGSASGGKTSTAWTSTDGRSWQPIANAENYAGVPTPPPGAPSIPSFTISDDGTHLLAVGMGDPMLGVSMWVSSDGVTWQQMPFSGATDTIPRWPGGTGLAIGTVYVVPGGLIVTGQGPSDTSESVWRVTALP
jgi:hypothetical protein